MNQADGVRQQIENPSLIRLCARLAHDVAFKRGYGFIRPGERDLDQMPKQRRLGTKGGVDRVMRDSSGFCDRRHGGRGIATREEELSRRSRNRMARLCRGGLTTGGVVATACGGRLDSVTHARYDSTYS